MMYQDTTHMNYINHTIRLLRFPTFKETGYPDKVQTETTLTQTYDTITMQYFYKGGNSRFTFLQNAQVFFYCIIS